MLKRISVSAEMICTYIPLLLIKDPFGVGDGLALVGVLNRSKDGLHTSL
jgi:hypothetical protein